jgi:hypothetical protein
MVCCVDSAWRRRFRSILSTGTWPLAEWISCASSETTPFGVICVKLWRSALTWSVSRFISYIFCGAIRSPARSTQNYCYRRKTQQWLSRTEVLDMTYWSETWRLPIFAFSVCMTLCKTNYWTTLSLYDLPQHTSLLPAPTGSQYKMSASPFTCSEKYSYLVCYDRSHLLLDAEISSWNSKGIKET